LEIHSSKDGIANPDQQEKDIRLDPVFLKEANIKTLLEYFMGKNTPDRQQHIIQNLRVELDILEEEVA